MALPLGIKSNHLAEASSIFNSFKLALDLGSWKVQIEDDSLNIINCLNLLHTSSCSIKYLVKVVLNIIKDFDSLYIYDIFREGNSLADAFENIGAFQRQGFYWNGIDPLPPNIEDNMKLDIRCKCDDDDYHWLSFQCQHNGCH